MLLMYGIVFAWVYHETNMPLSAQRMLDDAVSRSGINVRKKQYLSFHTGVLRRRQLQLLNGLWCRHWCDLYYPLPPSSTSFHYCATLLQSIESIVGLYVIRQLLSYSVTLVECVVKTTCCRHFLPNVWFFFVIQEYRGEPLTGSS